MLQRVTGALFGTRGQRQPAPETHIANIGDNHQLYSKAYLIEFFTGNEDSPVDVFTFSLPPENEELTYTQRKTEAKTFGGLHVDEYGIDAARIVLSGSTANQALKMIYKGTGSPKWLSGEEEIYYFRDLIKRYRSIGNLQKPANGKIIIYDLSKFARTNSAGNSVENYWQAFPGDFKITRSSDRPFTYKYSFEFTGVSLREGREFNSHAEPPDLDEGSLGLIQRMMNGLSDAIHFVDGIAARVNDVLHKVDQVGDALTVLGNVMSHSTNTLSGIVGSAGDSAAGVVDGAAGVVGGAGSVVSLPRNIQLRALNAGLEVQNSTNRLMKATESLVEECRAMFDDGGEYWDIPQDVLDRYAMNGEEFRDSVCTILNRAENAANELAAAAKSSDVPEVAVGNPDPVTGDQRLVLSYGYTSVTLKSTDTLESLAAEYLGDPDRAIDIATFNGVATLGGSDEPEGAIPYGGGSFPEDIQPMGFAASPARAFVFSENVVDNKALSGGAVAGRAVSPVAAAHDGAAKPGDLRIGDVIRIPITRRTGSVVDNRVYARRGDRDNYGRDVRLTDEGRIMASVSGDYALVGGARNLAQAVLLRLRESVARRIRLNAYGIRKSVADPTAGVAYVLSSIDLTVSGDPRVAAVEDIRFRGERDFLNVDVTYSDINGSGGNVAGRV